MEDKAYNVRITDKDQGSFTIGYWVVNKKSEAIREAKRQYPGHDKYEAILAF
jgi:hypothetical protein